METGQSASDGELVRRAFGGDDEAYVALAARYETPLFSYSARMLGGLGDGERCLVAALAAGWRELEDDVQPSQPQEWLYALMREECFDELARRGPATSGADDLGSIGDCVELAVDAALAALRPAYRDLLLLRDVHGLDSPTLCAVTDMSEPDVQHQLYRAREAFASTFAAQPAPDRCPARRVDCPDCLERERLRAEPQHALLHLGPLLVRDRVRTALRAALIGGGDLG
jgi:RNA polymerase sigma-70 factor (ECF subfamily)